MKRSFPVWDRNTCTSRGGSWLGNLNNPTNLTVSSYEWRGQLKFSPGIKKLTELVK